MKIAGIVAEYNPFHNGHRYQVEKTRELCQADYIVAVMSGHFLQRGEPALFNKWARAKMAVQGGVDIVVELPTAFSVRSASYFAQGAVAILDAMGLVTHLSFGSEAGEVEQLWHAARILNHESPEFKLILKKYMDAGISYPSARSKALTEIFPDNLAFVRNPDLLSSPNNILGIEYMRALLDLKSQIKPVTIKRIFAGYHDSLSENETNIASATGIRDELKKTGYLNDRIRPVVPSSTAAVIDEEIQSKGPVFMENLQKILFYILRTSSKEQLSQLCDITEGFENRLLLMAEKAVSVEDLLSKLKTKRFTWTRIQRILSYIMLDFSSAKSLEFDASGPQYIRVLGLSSGGKALLKRVKKNASLPVITRTAPLLKSGGLASEMLKLDMRATDVYNLLYSDDTLSPKGLDLKRMPYVEK